MALRPLGYIRVGERVSPLEADRIRERWNRLMDHPENGLPIAMPGTEFVETPSDFVINLIIKSINLAVNILAKVRYGLRR